MASYVPRSEQEADAFRQLFYVASKNGQLQAIGGADAVSFFVSSGLPISTLKQVWTQASNGKKEMGPQEFSTALRLIALAQNGHQVCESTLGATSGVKVPLPAFQGVELKPAAAAAVSAGAGVSSWALTPEAKAQYDKLWQGLEKNPTTGLVEGREAAKFFAQSGLDRDVLRKLWQLSDLTNDGVMDFNEFAICMHMIMIIKKKNEPAPSSLPQELLESALGQQQQQPAPFASAAPPPAINNLMNLSAFGGGGGGANQASFFNASRLDEPPPASFSRQASSGPPPPPPPAATMMPFQSASSSSSLYSAAAEAAPPPAIATSSTSSRVLASQLGSEAAASVAAHQEETVLAKSKTQLDDARLLVSDQISRVDADLAALTQEKQKLADQVEEANAKHLDDGSTLEQVNDLVNHLKKALDDLASKAQAARMRSLTPPVAAATTPTASSSAFAEFAVPPSPPPAAKQQLDGSDSAAAAKRRAAPIVPSTRPASTGSSSSSSFAMADVSTPPPPQQPPPPPPQSAYDPFDAAPSTTSNNNNDDDDSSNPFGQ